MRGESLQPVSWQKKIAESGLLVAASDDHLMEPVN
jgi:hypothetical protein